MITTKAYITELPEVDNNIFKVRVPLMEDSTGTEAIFNALLCSSPESFNGYSVGDCVFVQFEDDKLDTAIIIGKLYTNTQEESTTYNIVNELNVTDKVTLPSDTEIGGYNMTQILSKVDSITNINNNITTRDTRKW